MLTSGLFGYPADYLLWCLVFASLVIHTRCFFKYFPRERRRRLGLAIGNLLIFACMLGFAGLVGETYLRFYSIKTDAFGMTLPAQRWFTMYVQLNSMGCRDKEWTHSKPEGVRRIAFVGDSFTYGWGIERVEDRFPDLLQARFNEAWPASGVAHRFSGGEIVEVMNVAKPGCDTQDQLQPILDLIELYSVDEVVLCYSPNDIERLLPTTDDFNPTQPPQPRVFNTDSSCLLDYIYRRLYTPFVASVSGYHDWLADGYADPVLWRAQQERLGTIVETCKARDVTLRVALLPFILTGGEKYDAEVIHLQIRRFFEINDVPIVDLLPAGTGHPPEELVVSSQDPHPNEKANELFAGRIWEAFYSSTAE